MINIRVKKSNDEINEIDVSGHAGYADKGQDLICAGVSTIMFGLCNALDKLVKKTNISVNDNHIKIISTGNESEQIILKTGLIQLETIKEQAKEYINLEVSK